MSPEDIALINAYSIIITAVSTIILAVITIYYAIETHKMRIGSKEPMLSIQCDYAFGEIDVPRKLFICNYGPVAQNITLNAEVKVNKETSIRKIFLYSMACGERIEIVDNFYKVKDNNGEIAVKVKYHDANMKLYRVEFTIDFNQMTADRLILVPESPSTEISDISNVLQKLVKER